MTRCPQLTSLLIGFYTVKPLRLQRVGHDVVTEHAHTFSLSLSLSLFLLSSHPLPDPPTPEARRGKKESLPSAFRRNKALHLDFRLLASRIMRK